MALLRSSSNNSISNRLIDGPNCCWNLDLLLIHFRRTIHYCRTLLNNSRLLLNNSWWSIYENLFLMNNLRIDYQWLLNKCLFSINRLLYDRLWIIDKNLFLHESWLPYRLNSCVDCRLPIYVLSLHLPNNILKFYFLRLLIYHRYFIWLVTIISSLLIFIEINQLTLTLQRLYSLL